MWVDKQVWLADRDTATRNLAILTELRSHNAVLQTSLDWMRVRLNQVELGQSALIEKYMGVKLPVPIIEESVTGVSQSLSDGVVMFGDIGDKEAARLGIKWDENGFLPNGQYDGYDAVGDILSKQ